MAPPPPPPRPQQQQGRPESARKKAYKSGVDVDGARKRRQSQLIQLRKNRRDDTLSKKRHDDTSSSGQPDSGRTSPPDPSSPSNSDTDSNNLNEMVKGIWSENPSLQLEATIHFKKLISIDETSPIEELVRTGVVQRLVEFLSCHKLPQLQLEAAWALTNVVSGPSENTQIVTKFGAIPKLVELLNSPRNDVREQAVWALGNIAADSASCRELVIEHRPLIPLLSQFNEHAQISMLRVATWALSNLCFGRLPDKSQVKDILGIVKQLIRSVDEKIQSEACFTLYYLSDGTDDEIQTVVESGLCPQLVKLLMCSSLKVLTPVILTVASISAGNDSQVQVLIDSGVLSPLFQILSRNYNKSIKEQACITVSNICVGPVCHIQAVIDAKIMAPLLQLTQNGEEHIKKEALWAISNAFSVGSHDQIRYLVGQGCMKPLCDALLSRDPDLLLVCLNGLDCILKAGEMEKKDETCTNPYIELVHEFGGLDKLEDLQEFDNDVIYEKTIKLLESYWIEEQSEVQQAVPSASEDPLTT